MNSHDVFDDASGLWMVSGASSTLQMDPQVSGGGTGPRELFGDFDVISGTLDVDAPGFNTEGTLIWMGGTINCATSGGPATFRGS